jgi:hypothetical protein
MHTSSTLSLPGAIVWWECVIKNGRYKWPTLFALLTPALLQYVKTKVVAYGLEVCKTAAI